MTIHVSLDLETWGTKPGCDLRSIGAVVFDPVAGTVATMDHTDQIVGIGTGSHSFYIACDNPETDRNDYLGDLAKRLKYPLHRDPRTVQWWSEQSTEARAAFTNPVDLRDALVRFGDWLRLIEYGDPHVLSPSADLHIWSHGAATDVPWLAAAYDAVGLPVPWHYRAPRDTRTLFDAAGITDHSAWLAQYSTGTAHHALSDAICQARAVCAAWEKLA